MTNYSGDTARCLSFRQGRGGHQGDIATLLSEGPEFPGIGRSSPAEQVTGLVVLQILEPEPVKRRIFPNPGGEGEWMGEGVEEGTKELGRITKTLPVASMARRFVLR